jgi:hypothetical protein
MCFKSSGRSIGVALCSRVMLLLPPLPPAAAVAAAAASGASTRGCSYKVRRPSRSTTAAVSRIATVWVPEGSDISARCVFFTAVRSGAGPSIDGSSASSDTDPASTALPLDCTLQVRYTSTRTSLSRSGSGTANASFCLHAACPWARSRTTLVTSDCWPSSRRQ